MLKCSKYDPFLRDRSCIFGASKCNGDWILVSSVNDSFIIPSNEPWFSESSIFSKEADNKLKTAVTLRNNDERRSYSFSFSLKIDDDQLESVAAKKFEFLNFGLFESKRQSLKMNLLKQGTENINGMADISIIAANCEDGTAKRLLTKFYFMRTDKINLQSFAFDFNENELTESSLITVTLDTNFYIVQIFVDNELRKTFSLSLDYSLDLPLNKPFREGDEMNHFTIGDEKKALSLSSVFVFTKTIDASVFSSMKALHE